MIRGNLPPSETDEDAYIFIDHREEDASIATYVSERLDPAHALDVVEEDDEAVSVTFQGARHRIPLQVSRHDRYIMVASLAELLRGHYGFFLLEPSLGSDTHGLLVVPQSTADGWGGIPDHLVPLDRGYDYFNRIRVPYLGHEDSAPDFAADRERVSATQDAMSGLLEAMFSGKMTDEAAARIAAFSTTDPELKALREGRSQAEIAAELQKAFEETLQSPEVAAHKKEMDQAMADLQAAVRARPWWKFW